MDRIRKSRPCALKRTVESRAVASQRAALPLATCLGRRPRTREKFLRKPLGFIRRADRLLTVENPTRTAQYRQLIEQRRHVLQAQLAAISPETSPMVWELGCGHGHFLTAYAQSHPEELCVGVDIVGERIERANRKRNRAHLNNLHFIQADARLFLETLPAGTTFAKIFILFPDPWPKLRHHKHRIMQPSFLSRLASRVGEGARLYFRTDFGPYFEDTRRVLAPHPRWELIDEPWPFEFETVFQSRATSYDSLVARPKPIP